MAEVEGRKVNQTRPGFAEMSKRDWRGGGDTPVPTENPNAMPAVSDEFMVWLRAQPIPEVAPFSTLDGDGALKQLGVAQGVLYLKQVIFDQHKARVLERERMLKRQTVMAPPLEPYNGT